MSRSIWVKKTIKYPEVKVRLLGEDGNAFSILARTIKAMRRAGVSDDKIKEFKKEAFHGDYNHLLATVMAWVTTDEKILEDED